MATANIQLLTKSKKYVYTENDGPESAGTKETTKVGKCRMT